MVAKMKEQQDKVVSPLITELKVCEKINQEALAQYDKTIMELKAIYNVIRIPAMTREYHRILRKRESRQVHDVKN